MNGKQKRKVCFVITSLIHYSRSLLILRELNKHPNIDLSIVVGGTALLSRYVSYDMDLVARLKKEGYKKVFKIYFNLEGDSPVVKAKTAGLGMVEFALIFNNISPDMVVIRGDRFEVLSAATAASYINISIVHIEGGDLSGTLDESVRHAITKLSHIHLTTNEDARKRVIHMGEFAEHVFNVGSPDVEVAAKLGTKKDLPDLSRAGSGAIIDPGKDDFLIVMYQPVTSELDKMARNTKELLNAIHEMAIPAFWFWPNADAGAEEHISHELRRFNDHVHGHKIRFMRYLAPEQYLALLKHSRCLVGNSSAGIKESSYLGIPVVNIGTRQKGRLQGENVINVKEDKNAIKRAIKKQIRKERYDRFADYEGKDTSKRVAKIIATIERYSQKSFHDKK